MGVTELTMVGHMAKMDAADYIVCLQEIILKD